VDPTVDDSSSAPASRRSRHIALVGLSGVGKSTVAPMLARRRAMGSVDLDRVIERRAGATAAELFADHGERVFRDLESTVLVELLDGEPTVIATGGGVVLRAENRRRLMDGATVVWLRADPDRLAERLRTSPQDRPLLAGDAATALRSMARERDPLYLEVADLVVDVDSTSASTIAERLDRELTP
jgi:shikimate kinase